MPESTIRSPTLYWKCGCGKLQLKIHGEPWSTAVCHCHSCVATCRFIDEKYADVKDHVSGLLEGGSFGGFFKPNQITLLSEDLDDFPELGITKVGPKGKAVRKYVKCCGTRVGAVAKPFWCLNGNCLYEDAAHTKKYAPSRSILHCQKNNSFDPEKVPPQAYGLAPISEILYLLGVLINPFGPSTDPSTLEKFDVDAETADVVPITW
ncbi:MAG: hypothetical protein SGILL_008989, partial [Bacillariaceae sp.]